MNASTAVLIVVGILVCAGLYTLVATEEAKREATATDEMWVRDMNEFKRRATMRERRAQVIDQMEQRRRSIESPENQEPDHSAVTRGKQ